MAELGLLPPALAQPLAFFSPPGHTEDACGLGTWAGLCLVWQVGKEMLTQRPLLLAAPPLPTAASSQRLCPSPVFLTCFLSLFLLTALGLLLGTDYLAKMYPWGRGQV